MIIDDYLLEALIEKLKISDTTMRRARKTQANHGGLGIVDTLVAMGYVSHDDVRDAKAQHFGCAVADLSKKPRRTTLEVLSFEFVRRYEVLPLNLRRGVLTLAMLNPTDVNTADLIPHLTGNAKKVKSVNVVVLSLPLFIQKMEVWYPPTSQW